MRFAFVALASLVLAMPAGVQAATCTVTAARLYVKEGGFERPLASMVGYAIPTTVDEASGSIGMDLSMMPVGTFQISGVNNSIDVTHAGTATGKIDAAGNVYLNPVPVDFTTDLLAGVTLSAAEPLTSGIASVTLSGSDYATMGAPLDFATGSMKIEGQGVVMNAPVVGTSTTGFSLTCTLAPVPSQSALPAGPSLVARATARPGKPVTGQVVGDSIVLKGKIKNGATPLDPTQDVFVRVAAGDTELMLIRVPAGGLTAKGKKYTVTDTDGTAIHMVTGRKKDTTGQAAVSGSLTIVKSKKGFGVTLKEVGADLSALAASSAGTVTIGMGLVSPSDAVTVKPSARKTILK